MNLDRYGTFAIVRRRAFYRASRDVRCLGGRIPVDDDRGRTLAERSPSMALKRP